MKSDSFSERSGVSWYFYVYSREKRDHKNFLINTVSNSYSKERKGGCEETAGQKKEKGRVRDRYNFLGYRGTERLRIFSLFCGALATVFRRKLRGSKYIEILFICLVIYIGLADCMQPS